MRDRADVIVVGSGPSAVHAARAVVDRGLTVLMLDVGNEDTRYRDLIPDAPFLELRRTDPGQHRYLLGDEFEAVPLGRTRVGAQLTAPRAYIARDTDTLTPLVSNQFTPTESLALGGLGSGWGAQAIEFDDRDLAAFPISHADLAPHYADVAERIGLSGDRDDLLPYYGDCPSLQPPLQIDVGARLMMERYRARRNRLRREGFHMGHARLAVLSRDLGDRRAQAYHDMDFYSDAGRSVYRPWMTVESLRARSGFEYARPLLVDRFAETEEGGVRVSARETDTGRSLEFSARRLILAAGALGTARIVLRSLDRYGRPVPLACNPHIYVPSLNLAMLGRPATERRHSLTQAGIVYDPPGSDARDLLYGEVHVYRSLLHFKLVKESFLPVAEAWRIMRDLMSAFVILVIEHHDAPTSGKTCVLERSGAASPDRLRVDWMPDEADVRRQRRLEKRLLRLVRRIGCLPLKRIDPGPGSSIHYGGTFPMTREDRDLTVTSACLLRGTRSVYLADGSVFPDLPAKPLTLTLMANAHRVGTLVARDLTP